jgi:hypothetical protein
MAEGKQREEWARWSQWMAMFANANSDPKKRPTPYMPRDFNPFADREPVKRLSKTDSVKKLSEMVGARKS